MNAPLPLPWTPERFLTWAETQDQRYEFDGVRPVAMTGGTARHDRITGNIHLALSVRLRGKPCANYGPNLGVQTLGNRIRYPDALITCAKFSDMERLAPDPISVFEVLSPSSGSLDRVLKLREYAAVPSIRQYIIVEFAEAGLQLLYRDSGAAPWITLPLTGEDTLSLPDLGLDIPVAEFYQDITVGAAEGLGSEAVSP
jgi:Uma2 family endonuclease